MYKKRQMYRSYLSVAMKFVLLFFLFSAATGSRILLEEGSKDHESALDTEVTPIKGVKGWPREVCRCVCDVANSVWKFSKKCYGRVKRLCCNQSPRVGWQPMRQEEDRMDFNIGKQLVSDNNEDHNV
ncbi:hypothetical protein J6590_069457 [Homalodisca vitripennis]|nr:hypothetical protein J6590_069457 [Homalodisca vitripennis]